MASTEGIIFSDLFISNKDLFIRFFEQYYQEQSAAINSAISRLNNVLMKYTTQSVTAASAAEFESAWMEFQTVVLMNTQNLQLLVAYRGQSGLNARFSQILNQADVMGVSQTAYGMQYGINAGNQLVRDSIKYLEASKVEEFLQKHLNDLLLQLDSSISGNEAYLLHRYHTEFLNSYYKYDSEASLEGAKWREAFYSANDGFYFGGQGLGQVYDAFMNHLANYKPDFYDYLATGGANDINGFVDTEPDSSVYVEEGQVYETGHFPQLLSESRNHTGWYTGGDIIIVNPETMSIVYNIQLKTTTENKASIFAEKIGAIRAFINNLASLSNPIDMANKIFDFLLTSVSNHNDFDMKPQQEIDKLLTESLQLKLNIRL